MAKCGHPPLDRYTFVAGVPNVKIEWCRNCGALRFNIPIYGFQKDKFRRPRAWTNKVPTRKA